MRSDDSGQMMSLKELDKNSKALSSDRGLKTIINIREPEKQVEESVEMAKHSKTMMNSNETLNTRQHVHTLKMFQQNIVLKGEDFKTAASEVTLPSLKSDEKLKHVLKFNISSEASSKSVNKKCSTRKSISTMSINQDQSLCSGGLKPFDGNLSDDQKLVLSVSDGTSKCTIKNKCEMKVLNANVKGILISGKCSPYDDHLDSGTCSDAEVVSFAPSSDSPQPPPVPPKGVNSNRPKQHALCDSFCSDASSSSSSDSVQLTHSGSHLVSPDLIRSITEHKKSTILPSSLLIDIRNHPVTFSVNQDQDQDQDQNHDEDKLSGDDDEQEEGRYGGFECNDNDSSSDSINEKLMTNFHEEFLKFHMSEHLSYDMDNSKVMIHDESDESFAGIKDLRSGTSTIRSSKGTIRGVKNRVRNGIATFLQMQQTTVKVNCAHTTRWEHVDEVDNDCAMMKEEDEEVKKKI